MAKIDNNANLYDIDGNLIQKAPLNTPKIEDVEAELDKWTKKCKENPDNEMYRLYLNNLYGTLMRLYAIYGNPHEKELVEKIQAYEKEHGPIEDIKGELTTEEVKEALNAVAEEITPKETVMDEYVEYTEEAAQPDE